jgi:FKBP-type peptidyl-prolyl cis-trans isomerase
MTSKLLAISRLQIVLLGFFGVLLFSCQSRYEGYEELSDSAHFKLLRFGEGDLRVCDAHFCELSFKLIRHYDAELDFYNDYGFQRVSSEYLANGELGVSICGLKQGDTASYIFSYDQFSESLLDEYFSSNFKIHDTVSIRMEMKVLSCYSEKAYLKHQEELIREGMIEENNFLKSFLSDKGLLDSCRSIGDVWMMKTLESDGDSIKSGCDVEIEYRGLFLDGTEFDNTFASGTSLYFSFGKPDQVVRGMEMSLAHMREGESAIIYVPSHLAFGQKGSATGIIPPFTSVCFDIQITDVITPADSLNLP